MRYLFSYDWILPRSHLNCLRVVCCCCLNEYSCEVLTCICWKTVSIMFKVCWDERLLNFTQFSKTAHKIGNTLYIICSYFKNYLIVLTLSYPFKVQNSGFITNGRIFVCRQCCTNFGNSCFCWCGYILFQEVWRRSPIPCWKMIDCSNFLSFNLKSESIYLWKVCLFMCKPLRECRTLFIADKTILPHGPFSTCSDALMEMQLFKVK